MFDERFTPLRLLEYRFPILILFLGAVFLVTGFVLLQKESMPPSDLVSFDLKESSESGKLFVDVEGSVKYPGVYPFTTGERIADAIEKAGGIANDADVAWMNKHLNKAAKLTDGAKIYIPMQGERSVIEGKTLGAQEELININTASQAELETLSGIGPVTAEKIIAARPFTSIEDLKEKKILGNAVFDKIKDRISV